MCIGMATLREGSKRGQEKEEDKRRIWEDSIKCKMGADNKRILETEKGER